MASLTEKKTEASMLPSESSPSSLNDSGLLRQFSSEEEKHRKTAWKEFLARHSDLILEIAWQFTSDRDEAMETYLYVCERLAAEEFAKLRAYDPTRGETPAKVTTWLTVVVRHLCIDHHRQKEEARRYPDPVADLPPLDRKVFELYFWEGYSQREIVSILETSPEYDEDVVPSALNRLWTLELRPSKGWARQPPERIESLTEALDEAEDSFGGESPAADRHQWMETLLEELPPKQRLAVRWYYWTGMSASDISQLLDVSQRKVYTLLDGALESLREKIDTPTPGP